MQLRLLLRRRAGVPGGRPALEAEIVAAALEGGDAQRLVFDAGEEGLDDGQVLLDELLLKADGVGRDDDALAAPQGLEGGGDEVGERLAGAGTRFDDEVAAVTERRGDGGSHVLLLRTALEVGEELRQVAGAAEDLARLALADPLFAAAVEGPGNLVGLREEVAGEAGGVIHASAKLGEHLADRQGDRPFAGLSEALQLVQEPDRQVEEAWRRARKTLRAASASARARWRTGKSILRYSAMPRRL